MKTTTLPEARFRQRASAGKRPSLTDNPISVSQKVLLVPIDFSLESAKAIKSAAELARRRGSSIKLLHVVEPIEYIHDCGYGPVRRQTPNRALIEMARKKLLALARRHLKSEFKWQTSVRSGIPFEEIVAAARDVKPELILMPTRGTTESGKIAVGSTAERVVRHAGCPVLVLPKTLLLSRKGKA